MESHRRDTSRDMCHRTPVLAGDRLPALLACSRTEPSRLPVVGSWDWETVQAAQVETPHHPAAV